LDDGEFVNECFEELFENTAAMRLHSWWPASNVIVAELECMLTCKSTDLIGFWVGDLANCEAKT
tara:strand:+ start:12165 stop:12356 length:192 start_codon:yes stop_codon:yes gene_type:complete